MDAMIVYDSATGNTEYLARALGKALPGVPCCRVGTLSIAETEALAAVGRVYLGFWTDKGTCSQGLRELLPALAGKKVFLFGTSGFGASEDYFAQIIERVRAELPADCTVTGWFMCAGRMSEVVRLRYEEMLENPETERKAQLLLANFDAVQAHPNADDALALLAKAGAGRFPSK